MRQRAKRMVREAGAQEPGLSVRRVEADRPATGDPAGRRRWSAPGRPKQSGTRDPAGSGGEDGRGRVGVRTVVEGQRHVSGRATTGQPRGEGVADRGKEQY